MPRVASKGAKLTDFVTSKWFNQQNKRYNVPTPFTPTIPQNPVAIKCLGDASKTFDRFDPANISNPLISYEDWGTDFSPQYNSIACLLDYSLETDNWGIVQGPCDPYTASVLVLEGITWAKFTVTDLSHTHVTTSGSVLTSNTSGRGRIIRKETGSVPYDTVGLIHISSSSVTEAGVKIVQSPVGGIAARSGTTVSFGSCTEYKIVTGTLTTNTNTINVYNLNPIAVPASYYIIAIQEVITNQWIAQVPGIINLRLSGSNLQYTLDGTNWTTWTTGTTCP
jgi:hypothetical protein